jgi:hypothetical protein
VEVWGKVQQLISHSEYPLRAFERCAKEQSGKAAAQARRVVVAVSAIEDDKEYDSDFSP